MQLITVKIDKPETRNFIFGQAHFIKTVEDLQEVCATANPAEVILAETEQGRAVLGVVDGLHTKGIEGEDDIKWRKDLLRQIGYKL